MKVELSAIKELTEELPSNWEGRRLKYVSNINFSNVNKKTEDGEKEVNLCNYVDVYYNDFITSELAFMKATATDEEIRKFLLHKGNVLITKDSETADDIGIPAYVSEEIDNLVCGYHLAILRAKKFVDGRYLFRFLQSKQIAAYFETRANGITRYAIGLDTVGGCPVLFPPLPIQKDIATFLDKETARIDALIEKKNRQIELLQEKRQAVITRAITKGLDPNVKMKDSGIEWIGEIPEGWEVRKIKHLCRIKTGSTPDTGKIDSTGDIRWYTPSDFNGNLLLSNSSRMVDLTERNNLHMFPPNTVLLVAIGATLGKVAISHYECSANQQINAIIPRTNKLTPLFLLFCLISGKESIKNISNATTLGIINQEKTGSVVIPYPSSEEQILIAKYLERVSNEIDTITSSILSSISILQEYRLSLITAAVSGQIDVSQGVSK